MIEPPPTLRELRTGTFSGTPLAVLGHPIGHSLSPPMHNAALAHLARSDFRYSTWKYHRFEVPPADLPAALELLAAKGFRGVNLTVPHKVLAFEQLRDIDPAARPAGAVNTLLREGDAWKGFNTDGYGLSGALRDTLGIELRGQAVILLGAGGAARGAAVECLARGCARLAIGNRTAANRDALLELLGPLAGGCALTGFDPAQDLAELPPDAIVINATSAGLREGDPAPVRLEGLQRPRAVFDMIYNPSVTPLLAAAVRLGLPHANGLAMLVHQGAKSLEIWTGVPAATTAPWMAEALAP